MKNSWPCTNYPGREFCRKPRKNRSKTSKNRKKRHFLTFLTNLISHRTLVKTYEVVNRPGAASFLTEKHEKNVKNSKKTLFLTLKIRDLVKDTQVVNWPVALFSWKTAKNDPFLTNSENSWPYTNYPGREFCAKIVFFWKNSQNLGSGTLYKLPRLSIVRDHFWGGKTRFLGSGPWSKHTHTWILQKGGKKSKKRPPKNSWPCTNYPGRELAGGGPFSKTGDFHKKITLYKLPRTWILRELEVPKSRKKLTLYKLPRT